MKNRILWMLPVAAGAAALATVSLAGPGDPPYSNVPANQRVAGYAPPSNLSPQLREQTVAQGSMPLENPDGTVGWYGYENSAPSPTNPAFPQMVPATGAPMTEAKKTEPDKNAYLHITGQHGPDAGYDYGSHFLYQGHEGGAPGSLITRINLDADSKHRVTLLADKDASGQPLSTIDGITWDPWAKRLLLTTENINAATYSATLDWPSQVVDVSGALGRGGYEGIQDDFDGNIWIVEDIGGANKPGGTARRPNSFLYRYVPRKKGDLQNGKLQVLQVMNAGHPVTFDSQAALNAPDQVALRTYGASYDTKWITIHDTASDGSAPFQANTLAKAAGGAPFKRPENGVFRPGSGFTEFYFDETGDTNATSPENGDSTTGAGGAGGWTSIFKLAQTGGPSSDTGKLSLFYEGNEAVAGLDNVAFLSRDLITFVEDAGATLHQQRNALDSGYVFDVTQDYSHGLQPIRWLGLGRDPSATLDAANGGFGVNEDDNEITGVHVSDGNPGMNGILGAQIPDLSQRKWRWFYTQQHGDNFTWEVTPTSRGGGDD